MNNNFKDMKFIWLLLACLSYIAIRLFVCVIAEYINITTSIHHQLRKRIKGQDRLLKSICSVNFLEWFLDLISKRISNYIYYRHWYCQHTHSKGTFWAKKNKEQLKFGFLMFQNEWLSNHVTHALLLFVLALSRGKCIDNGY